MNWFVRIAIGIARFYGTVMVSFADFTGLEPVIPKSSASVQHPAARNPYQKRLAVIVSTCHIFGWGGKMESNRPFSAVKYRRSLPLTVQEVGIERNDLPAI